MTELRVDQHTSLQQLQAFTNDLHDNSKVRGRTNEDGSITLYVSKKLDTGFKEFFWGHRTERENNARVAIDRLLEQFGNDPHVGGKGQETLGDIRISLPQGGNLSGGELKQTVSESGITVRKNLPFPMRILETIQSGSPRELDDIRKNVVDELVVAEVLTPEQQMDFVTTKDDVYKDKIVAKLNAWMGAEAFGPNYAGATPQVREFVDSVHAGLVGSLPDRIVDEKTVIIDSKLYTRDEGQKAITSGFGSIERYKARDGSEIMLKTPILGHEETIEAKFDEASNECHTHLQAMGGGHENVIGLKGVVRTPDGGLALALEYAPHGDLMQMTKAIKDAEAKGLITPESAYLARATLFMDMLQGMQHMHGQGCLHEDVKPGNFLVGEDGSVKLCDFDKSLTAPSESQTKQRIDNPIWLAPEVIVGHKEIREKCEAIQKMVAAAITSERAKLEGKFSKDEIDRLLGEKKRTLMERVGISREDHPVVITQKVDTWSVGATAYTLFFGENRFEREFVFQTENDLRDFSSKPENRVIQPQDGRNLEPFEDLINNLMHPVPEERPQLNIVQEDPMFQSPGVGSPEVRALIAKIGDMGKAPEEVTDQDRNDLRELSRHVTESLE